MTVIEPPFPSFVSKWHNDTYAEISPTRPELSTAGKTIVIAGGGQGIGRGIAEGFAEADAAHIALLGRRLGKLGETKQAITQINSKVSISTHQADVTDEKALSVAAKEIGHWDVLVINAGVQYGPVNAIDSDMNEWWRVFEV